MTSGPKAPLWPPWNRRQGRNAPRREHGSRTHYSRSLAHIPLIMFPALEPASCPEMGAAAPPGPKPSRLGRKDTTGRFREERIFQVVADAMSGPGPRLGATAFRQVHRWLNDRCGGLEEGDRRRVSGSRCGCRGRKRMTLAAERLFDEQPPPSKVLLAAPPGWPAPPAPGARHGPDAGQGTARTSTTRVELVRVGRFCPL